MIAFLRGRLHDKQPQRVVVDVGGVGYDVAVPLSTFYQLGDEGSEVALRIHTHVREDQLALFGFLTASEQVVFERLLGVSGIGPKLALGVLSGIEPVEFVAALERGDVARLTRIPGVGKKTAERMVLELRDRLLKDLGSGAGVAASAVGAGERDDLVSALINLGYDRRAVDRVVGAQGQELSAWPFEQQLRAALKALSRA
jgi:Holliday junction DNA helicase RuvA